MKGALILGVMCALCGVLCAQWRPEENNGVNTGRGLGRFPGYSATQTSEASGQLYVNDVARKVHSGLGTADYYGVPGTYFSNDYRHDKARYGYGQGRKYRRNDGYGFNAGYVY